jgi:hypothetical protein
MRWGEQAQDQKVEVFGYGPIQIGGDTGGLIDFDGTGVGGMNLRPQQKDFFRRNFFFS